MVRLKKKKTFMGVIEEEFHNEHFIEGAIIRPAIQMLSFVSFIISMFLLLIGNLKWGGSLILFSFILNLESIYRSLTDKPSIYRTLNLGFKLVMFVAEVALFNYVLMLI